MSSGPKDKYLLALEEFRELQKALEQADQSLDKEITEVYKEDIINTFINIESEIKNCDILVDVEFENLGSKVKDYVDLLNTEISFSQMLSYIETLLEGETIKKFIFDKAEIERNTDINFLKKISTCKKVDIVLKYKKTSRITKPNEYISVIIKKIDGRFEEGGGITVVEYRGEQEIKVKVLNKILSRNRLFTKERGLLPYLNICQSDYAEVKVADIANFLKRGSDKLEIENQKKNVIEVLGLKITNNIVFWAAPISLIFVLLYLLGNVKYLRCIAPGNANAILEFPWMGVYTNNLNMFLCYTSLTILPMLSIILLITKYYIFKHSYYIAFTCIYIAFIGFLSFYLVNEIIKLNKLCREEVGQKI